MQTPFAFDHPKPNPKDGIESAGASNEVEEAGESPNNGVEAAGAPNDGVEASDVPNDGVEAVRAPKDGIEAAGAPKDSIEASGGPKDGLHEADDGAPKHGVEADDGAPKDGTLNGVEEAGDAPNDDPEAAFEANVAPKKVVGVVGALPPNSEPTVAELKMEEAEAEAGGKEGEELPADDPKLKEGEELAGEDPKLKEGVVLEEEGDGKKEEAEGQEVVAVVVCEDPNLNKDVEVDDEGGCEVFFFWF